MKKALYLLGQLSDSDVEWMIREGAKEHLAAGATLIREGQPITAVYILLNGTVEVTGSGLSGAKPIRLGCGEIVGEMSFIESRPPSATVTAVENSVVLAVPRPKLAAKLKADSGFAARFYHSLAVFLSHRLRDTVHRLGYGKADRLREDVEYEDELDPQLLDNIHLAGSRFDRVLQRLLGE